MYRVIDSGKAKEDKAAVVSTTKSYKRKGVIDDDEDEEWDESNAVGKKDQIIASLANSDESFAGSEVGYNFIKSCLKPFYLFHDDS